MSGEDRELPARPSGPVQQLAGLLVEYVGEIPSSSRLPSQTPAVDAAAIGRKASLTAASTAGMLSLPPGPLGWATILPEIIAVWKIQGQMVADIAAVYGQTAALSREQMLYCLFRHSAAQAVRDLVVRVGERYLVRQTTLAGLQHIARKVGVKISQKALAKGISRWIPLVSTAGVSSYAWYDTSRVARTAIELFESEILVEPPRLLENEKDGHVDA